MTVLDRVHRKRQMVSGQLALTEAGFSTEPQSSIPVRSEPPVIIRLRAVLGSLQQFISENDGGSGLGRFSWLIGDIMDELADEVANTDKDSESLSIYMAQMGQLISWIGHGNNDMLPDNLRSFAKVNELEAPRVHAS